MLFDDGELIYSLDEHVSTSFFLFPILRNVCARRAFLFITVSMCAPLQPEKKSSAGREGAVDAARVGAKYTIYRRERVQSDPQTECAVVFLLLYTLRRLCRRIIRPSALREKSYVRRPLPTIPSTSFRENTIETLLFLIPVYACRSRTLSPRPRDSRVLCWAQYIIDIRINRTGEEGEIILGI